MDASSKFPDRPVTPPAPLNFHSLYQPKLNNSDSFGEDDAAVDNSEDFTNDLSNLGDGNHHPANLPGGSLFNPSHSGSPLFSHSGSPYFDENFVDVSSI